MITGHPIEALVKDVGVFRIEELAVGGKLPKLQRDLFVAPLLFEISLVETFDGSASMPLTTKKLSRSVARVPSPWIWNMLAWNVSLSMPASFCRSTSTAKFSRPS